MTRVLRWSQWVAVKYNISWQCKAKDKKLVRAWLKTLFYTLFCIVPKMSFFNTFFKHIFFHPHFSIHIFHQHPPSAVSWSSFYRHPKHPGSSISTCKHLISVAHWDLCYLSALKTRLWMAKDKKREESFGESKERILSVSTRIKETRCGTVEETHRNG